MSKPVWVVRAGRDAVFAQDFLQLKMVAIGWGLIGDIKAIHDREGIVELLRQTYPDYTSRQVAVNAGQIYRFREELLSGCSVVTYDNSTRVYHLGTVIGEYKFRSDFDEGLRHTKPVDWHAQVSRDDLMLRPRTHSVV